MEKRKTEAIVRTEALKREAAERQLAEAQKRAAVAAGASGKIDPGNTGSLASVAVEETELESYVFAQRVVPSPPSFLRGENTRLLVEQDLESNSWVWMGSPVLGAKILQLAKLYDKQQVEFDLDFVFVLVSEDDLKEFGVSAIFVDEGAAWLNSLRLEGGEGSLRLASGGLGVELNFACDVGSISVLSRPTVRVVSGSKFQFSTDTQVPVPQTQIIDGVTQNSIEYKAIGFGLDGVCTLVGGRIKLALVQRNGSLLNRNVEGAPAPEFGEQTLSTSAFLEWWAWSPVGGIQVDREEISKGILSSRKEKSRDYLIVFARPRDALKAPPRALPPGALTPAEFAGHPLLPAPGEIEQSEESPSSSSKGVRGVAPARIFRKN